MGVGIDRGGTQVPKGETLHKLNLFTRTRSLGPEATSGAISRASPERCCALICVNGFDPHKDPAK